VTQGPPTIFATASFDFSVPSVQKSCVVCGQAWAYDTCGCGAALHASCRKDCWTCVAGKALHMYSVESVLAATADVSPAGGGDVAHTFSISAADLRDKARVLLVCVGGDGGEGDDGAAWPHGTQIAFSTGGGAAWDWVDVKEGNKPFGAACKGRDVTAHVVAALARHDHTSLSGGARDRCCRGGCAPVAPPTRALSVKIRAAVAPPKASTLLVLVRVVSARTWAERAWAVGQDDTFLLESAVTEMGAMVTDISRAAGAPPVVVAVSTECRCVNKALYPSTWWGASRQKIFVEDYVRAESVRAGLRQRAWMCECGASCPPATLVALKTTSAVMELARRRNSKA